LLLLAFNSKQHCSPPVILITFIILFVALAIAMFGGYEFQFTTKNGKEKTQWRQYSQKAGKQLAFFIMGVISGLVASPLHQQRPTDSKSYCYCTKW